MEFAAMHRELEGGNLDAQLVDAAIEEAKERPPSQPKRWLSPSHDPRASPFRARSRTTASSFSDRSV